MVLSKIPLCENWEFLGITGFYVFGGLWARGEIGHHSFLLKKHCRIVTGRAC
jgi:hypothetical protein